MADGFLSRWSKRKSSKEDGVPEDNSEPHQELVKESAQTLPLKSAAEEVAPPPTLEDVAKIDRFDPDFSAFMKPDVDPAVQQAALKKMFTDPHFNIMDGLDIYIDDYSKPDPLPAGMLERMVQGDMLKLFSQQGDGPENAKQGESQSMAAPVESAELEGHQPTDLTSTLPKHSAQLDEVSDTSPIEPKQKKT